jgi:hypothetical protein
VVKVMSGNVTEVILERPRLLAVLNYQSHWDMWHRFNLFLIRFYELIRRWRFSRFPRAH